ncbi:MAG: serine/threonine-protein kinase [Bacteroidales bacterium]|nr:serine/threonine-protein kinase [Bacteroidales bacterium]
MEDILDTSNIFPNFDQNQFESTQLVSGTILEDRYKIIDVIGVGGMGSVYKARDLRFSNTEKLVAIKEMINQALDSLVQKTIVQNFEREANILASLSHPSIPKIFDFFTRERRSYLVLELIDGKDLEDIVSDTPGNIPVEKVIQWGIELCEVLHYLHSMNPTPVVFRDMKPSNVMVNKEDHIILIDFGIAKDFRTGKKGTMVGTEGYSPPEQYRGEATPLADMYALGATLHHLLTRRDPRLEAPFTFPDRSILDINPKVSSELAAIIEKSLQYEPTERFSSIHEMADELKKISTDMGTIHSEKEKISFSGTSPSVSPIWTFKCEDEIRGSASILEEVVFFGSYDKNLFALKKTTGELLWKYPTEGGIIGKPIIHRKQIFFGSEDNRLFVLSPRNGKLLWTFESGGPVRCSPNIAEGHVFFGSDDHNLYAVNIDTSRIIWKVNAGGPVRSTPVIDNEHVYFGCETGEFLCVNFHGNIKWRYKTKRAVTSSPVISKGTVFFSSLDSQIHALDVTSGFALWRFRMGNGSISSPCISERRLFVGSADGYIYCLDTKSGQEVWKYKTEHQVISSPVISDDKLYCGSADGNLYCLNKKDGKLIRKYKTGGPITGTPLVVDNVVYIGSFDQSFYAFQS